MLLILIFLSIYILSTILLTKCQILWELLSKCFIFAVKLKLIFMLHIFIWIKWQRSKVDQRRLASDLSSPSCSDWRSPSESKPNQASRRWGRSSTKPSSSSYIIQRIAHRFPSPRQLQRVSLRFLHRHGSGLPHCLNTYHRQVQEKKYIPYHLGYIILRIGGE